MNKGYVAELPVGYQGEYGPGIKALAITLYFEAHVSQPKILELFADVGILISAGQLSNFLIKKQYSFRDEKTLSIKPASKALHTSISMTHLPVSTAKITTARLYAILSTPLTSRQKTKAD